MEDYLPRAFAEPGSLRDSLAGLDTRIGVRLEGEGGGEWVVHIEAGGLRVVAERRTQAAFSVIQSVRDWRGALWEGRGGAVGRQATAIFHADDLGAAEGSAGGLGRPPTPAVLARMDRLDGLMRMVISGCDDGEDWRIDFKLGPGEIPPEPTTTITLRAEDAEALERGELNPLEAFMAGRIRVLGDVTLMLQMQAIQLELEQEHRE